MSLTEAQKITLFEILEVPYSGSVDIPSDDYRLDAITRDSSNSDYALISKITSRLSELTTAEETRLISYITEWDALGLDVTDLSGSVGGISGITDIPATKRMLIQARVKITIPVIKYISELSNSNQNISSIPVIR